MHSLHTEIERQHDWSTILCQFRDGGSCDGSEELEAVHWQLD